MLLAGPSEFLAVLLAPAAREGASAGRPAAPQPASQRVQTRLAARTHQPSAPRRTAPCRVPAGPGRWPPGLDRVDLEPAAPWSWRSVPGVTTCCRVAWSASAPISQEQK